jgi:hypothetical protein
LFELWQLANRWGEAQKRGVSESEARHIGLND